MLLTAEEIFEILRLQPHPEGGAFRETYRSPVSSATDPKRSVCTAIYFLIRKNHPTSWHRVKNDEIYHFYHGAPVELTLIDQNGNLSKHILGVDVKNGERPQFLIPGGFWQSARTLNEFTLIGCTVSPGFDFEDFEMIDIDSLRHRFPHLYLT